MAVLNFPAQSSIGVAGTRAQFDVTGNDVINDSGYAISGTIDLAANSHLVVTGNLNFVYTDQLIGDPTGSITNNGSIMTMNGIVSVPVDGNGTLGFGGYHDGMGISSISAPIGSNQTVQLDPHSFGMRLTLADPADFHGLLNVMPNPLPGGDVSVVLSGVKADGFVVNGEQLTLFNAGQVVDTLRVSNPGSVPITADFGADTTLTFHTAPDPVVNLVREFYQGGLGRDADPGGLAFWTNELKTGALTPRDFVFAITGSSEGQARYGQQTDGQYVDSVYANALGRQSDPGGHAAWTNLLQSGCARADVMAAITQSPEGQQHFMLSHA